MVAQSICLFGRDDQGTGKYPSTYVRGYRGVVFYPPVFGSFIANFILKFFTRSLYCASFRKTVHNNNLLLHPRVFEEAILYVK